MIESIAEIVEVLGKEDFQLKDPTLVQLRGLALTLSYVYIVHPEYFLFTAEDWADIVFGRLSLLATSKLAGNMLIYCSSMTLFRDSFLGDDPPLIVGNLIQKVAVIDNL